MAVNPEQQAFLDAIIAAPADDTPRLVYADWLQENGDEIRAEFIRLQIELARTPSYKDTKAQKAHVKTLMGKNNINCDTWVHQAWPELPKEVFNRKGKYSEEGWQLDPMDFEFQRGFPTKLTVTEDNYRTVLEQAPILFGAKSCLEELIVENVPGFIGQLEERLNAITKKVKKAGKETPEWNRLSRITLNNDGVDDIYVLFENYVDRLAANIADFEALGRHRLFSKMTAFSCKSEAASVAETTDAYRNAEKDFLASPNAIHINDLQISNARLLGDELNVLIDSRISNLRTLHITNNDIDDVDYINAFMPLTQEFRDSFLKCRLNEVTSFNLNAIDSDDPSSNRNQELANSYMTLFLDAMPKLQNITLNATLFGTCSPEVRSRILAIPNVTLNESHSHHLLKGYLKNGIGKKAQHLKINTTEDLTPTQLGELLKLLDNKATIEVPWTPDGTKLSNELENRMYTRNNVNELA